MALRQLRNRFIRFDEVINTFEFMYPNKLKTSEESTTIKTIIMY